MNIFRIKKTIGNGNPLSKSYFSSAHKKNNLEWKSLWKLFFLRIKRKQWEVEISSKSMIFLRIKKIKHNGKWKSPIKSHDLFSHLKKQLEMEIPMKIVFFAH